MIDRRQPALNKLLLLELSKGEFLGRWEYVLLVGPSGTVKMHLATAACLQSRKAQFSRITESITTLLQAQCDLGRQEK